MLEVKNLTVSAGGRRILDRVNLRLEKGQHAILLGPNGSGKSTLLQTIMGLGRYEIEEGDITVDGQSILGMDIEERVETGLGIMVQLPPMIEGVTLGRLVEEIRKLKHHEVTRGDFTSSIIEGLKHRNVNENFSGGEIKLSELFQLLHLQPMIALIDEPESGVDLESINLIGQTLRTFLRSNPDRTSLIITHSGKIIDYTGDLPVFLMDQGQIVRSEPSAQGLIKEIEASGFLSQHDNNTSY